MAYPYLATYLNDHLAGSTTATELLSHLETTHAGTDLEPFLSALRADAAADRQELEALIARLNISESRQREAVTWLTEKLTRLKLSLDDRTGGPLHLLEALEAIALGIEGKRLLWRTLSSISEGRMELQGIDYHYLEQRAAEQRDRVESVRLKAAETALIGEGGRSVI